MCGGWVFTKTFDICVHGGHHLNGWNFISELGLQGDKSFRVQEACEEPSDPPRAAHAPQPAPQYSFQPGTAHRPRPDLHYARDRAHDVPAPAPAPTHTQFLTGGKGVSHENNNYLLGLLYRK